jgi:hypothetical protein
MRSVGRKGVVAVVVLMVLGLIVASGLLLERLRADRDAAQSAANEAQRLVAESSRRLAFAVRVNNSYRRSDGSQREVIQALRSQIRWDKSHLLDCWTAIVEVLARHGGRGRLMDIFGPDEVTNLTRSARTGHSLAFYIQRCASDAVP